MDNFNPYQQRIYDAWNSFFGGGPATTPSVDPGIARRNAPDLSGADGNQAAPSSLAIQSAPQTGMNDAVGVLLEKVATLEAKIRAIEAKL